jgi:hypothetical protein
MTTVLNIFASEAVRATHASDAVLASLPLSYAPAADAGAGGVTVVDGSGRWPAATVQALQAGAVGVIVVQPGPAGLDELRAFAANPGVVVIDSTWASNPVVAAAGQALDAAIGQHSRVECRIVVRAGTDLDRALLDQLSLLRALVGPVVDLEILHRSEHGYVGEARANGAAVDLSVVCTSASPESATVRLLTSDGSIEVDIPSGETARPAHLTITNPSGAQITPTLYESGHRATWRRLHRLITSGEPADDLDGLEADIATAAQQQHHARN